MHVSAQLCVLGVYVCSRCVTHSVQYSNRLSEARKQLSVPSVKYRKTCQHLAKGAHHSLERMLSLELVHERTASLCIVFVSFKGGCVISCLVFSGKVWITLCKVGGCLG